MDGGWDIEESVQLAKVLKEKGVDGWWRSIHQQIATIIQPSLLPKELKKELGFDSSRRLNN
jgi:hypothetical protein